MELQDKVKVKASMLCAQTRQDVDVYLVNGVQNVIRTALRGSKKYAFRFIYSAKDEVTIINADGKTIGKRDVSVKKPVIEKKVDEKKEVKKAATKAD